MLKSYDELRKIDVAPYCDMRKEGEKQIPYLNWAKCIDLLHLNGAKTVFFEPIRSHNGSSLIYTDQVFTDSKGNTNRVYETRIKVVIDDLEEEFQGPLMNGANPVKDNSMSQQRLWNCQCRLFVKAVAIHTGLGFDLWIKGEKEEAEIQKKEDVHHDILKVRERVLKQFTYLNKKGLSKSEIAEKMNLLETDIDMYFNMYMALAKMENNLILLVRECQ